MARFDLDDIKSSVFRLQMLVEAAEREPSSWDRSVAMGEIRLMAVSLFELSQNQLKEDDPHSVGSRTLFAYMIDAFKRWDTETAEERRQQELSQQQSDKEWAMSPEEWKAYKESDEFKRSRGQQ
jgi:hypothetical protein